MSVNFFNEQNFEKEVLNFTGYVLVDFYADWCGPCKVMSSIIDSLAQENLENLKIGKINVDDCSNLARNYNIMSIPTIMLFKDGNNVKTFIGVTDKDEIKKFII